MVSKVFLLAALLAAAVARPQEDEQWHSWKTAHSKFYAHPKEEAARRQIWMENSVRILEHNAGNRSFTLGLNQFSDMVRIIASSHNAYVRASIALAITLSLAYAILA